MTNVSRTLAPLNTNQISDISINSTLNRPETNRGHLRISFKTAAHRG